MKLSQRTRYILLAITGVILIVAMVFQLRSGGSQTDGVRGRLGPTPGPDASSADYIAEKREYLSTLADTQSPDPVAALVSFHNLIPAPRAQEMVGSMEATFVWARFPGSEPEPLQVGTTVSGAVADRTAELRQTVDAEIKDLESQEQTPEITELIATRKAELAKLGADCACVFAISVEDAQPRDLQTLAEAEPVKLVDVPDPATNDLDGWELTPFAPRA